MITCGLCKQEKRLGQGLLFHAVDDWSDTRLFICDECFQNVAVQRSSHELCYECGEHLSLDQLADLPPNPHLRLDVLDRAINDFEKSHGALFEQIPASTDPSHVHPGSIHPGLREWQKKHAL